MAVDKITNAPTQNEAIAKINEIIDNLGTAVGANTDLSNLSATGEAKFQAPLVSGTNIKTINNNSILGSGNLALDVLPSQTGHSGEFLTTDGTSANWGKVPTRNIGEIVESTIPLTDAGLHLLDGALLQYGSYQAFIDYIADLYNSGNYTDIFETEANWQTSVTNYGVCGKFVYDDVNNTVRLPKITGIVEGTTDLTALGDLVQAGLPNITGDISRIASGTQEGICSGAFTLNSSGSNYRLYSSGNYENTIQNVSFSATNSNPIYGNSSTVQPQAIKVLYYIVIATTTKTSVEVDIDEIATDLNRKADVDLSNISASSSAKNAITTWMLPDLTSGIGATWNTDYSCPSNGWVYITGNSQSSNYVYLYINSVSFRVASFAASTAGMASLFVPVSQGDIVKGTGGLNTQSITFYPMKGV